MDPTVTFPKLALVGVIVIAGCSPDPLTGITAAAPCEVVTVIFPVTFSEAVGLNVTLITALPPAAIVVVFETPLAEKSFAFTLTWDTVRLVFPLFVKVTFCEFELPAFTLEKLTLVGFAESVTVAAVPVPLTAKTFGELGALLAILTVPLRVPAVVGANKTLKVVLLPAASVAGVTRPLAL